MSIRAVTSLSNLELPSRIVIDRVSPCIDCGNSSAKRAQGEMCRVETVILCDGHDELEGRLWYRHETESEWRSVSLQLMWNDIWWAEFRAEKLGFYSYYVEASIAGSSANRTRQEGELRLWVDPPLAGMGAWYEFFPRSFGRLRDCGPMLEYVASLGFDIVYLPPIHPIGRSFRKGKNNSLSAASDDVGSPWAIGGAEGGHKAIHPDLGTFEDFAWFIDRAKRLGLEVALDIAFQCSPDHPYVREKTQWFRKRSDGTIQYAENPPKKYQDIYPFDFQCEDWRSLWEELKSVFLFWIERGVKVFRVDNPHTKPLMFWEWVIAEVRSRYPEVIFLSEAFTRPYVMKKLAKAGFNQSYTYFAWRNSKRELREYLAELMAEGTLDSFRPNFWPNTPDILNEYLQGGHRSAFITRIALAATLSPNYGIYGPAFELLEHRPRESGSEEYLDSEKYQVRHWDLNRPDSIAPVIERINRIRREHRAFSTMRTIRVIETTNENIFSFSKTAEEGDDLVLVVANLDPAAKQSGEVDFPIHEYGIAADETYQVHDLMTDARYFWHGWRNFVELDPAVMPVHVFSVKRRIKREHDFEYFQ